MRRTIRAEKSSDTTFTNEKFCYFCSVGKTNDHESEIMNPQYPNFDEYIRQGEPGKKEKASIWQTAIGLQAVDGLTTSDYLKETARKHIEGEINIDEVRNLIKTYYQSKTKHESDDDDKQEADKVSANTRGISAMRWSVPTTKVR